MSSLERIGDREKHVNNKLATILFSSHRVHSYSSFGENKSNYYYPKKKVIHHFVFDVKIISSVDTHTHILTHSHTSVYIHICMSLRATILYIVKCSTLNWYCTYVRNGWHACNTSSKIHTRSRTAFSLVCVCDTLNQRNPPCKKRGEQKKLIHTINNLSTNLEKVIFFHSPRTHNGLPF